MPLATLRERHVAEHRRLFRRLTIDLPRGKRALSPTDQRLEHAGDGDDPSLAALYVQFARYLMLSSSRPGSQPANLQGIWNESNQPPWGSKYTININTEMNRSEEHTSELQSLMRNSYAVFCLKKKKKKR